LVNCKHRQGTINNICIGCGTPLERHQLKYSNELRKMIEKERDIKIKIEEMI